MSRLRRLARRAGRALAGLPGWLDRRPTWQRDLIVGAASSVTGWVITYVVPTVKAWGGPWAALGAVLVLLIFAVTRWTQAYGSGS